MCQGTASAEPYRVRFLALVLGVAIAGLGSPSPAEAAPAASKISRKASRAAKPKPAKKSARSLRGVRPSRRGPGARTKRADGHNRLGRTRLGRGSAALRKGAAARKAAGNKAVGRSKASPVARRKAVAHRRIAPRKAAPRRVALAPASARPSVRPGPIRRLRNGLTRARTAIARTWRRVFRIAPQKHATDLSVSGLTILGTRGLTRTRLPMAEGLTAATGVAGAALIWASVSEFKKSTSALGRAEAIHGMAWGGQAIASAAGALGRAGAALSGVGNALGVGGGAIQAGVGITRLVKGWKSGNRAEVALGLIDVGAGAAWAASSVTANPVALGAFLGLTAVRLVFTNSKTARRLIGAEKADGVAVATP